jgi:hypothetical protein
MPKESTEITFIDTLFLCNAGNYLCRELLMSPYYMSPLVTSGFEESLYRVFFIAVIFSNIKDL